MQYTVEMHPDEEKVYFIVAKEHALGDVRGWQPLAVVGACIDVTARVSCGRWRASQTLASLRSRTRACWYGAVCVCVCWVS